MRRWFWGLPIRLRTWVIFNLLLLIVLRLLLHDGFLRGGGFRRVGYIVDGFGIYGRRGDDGLWRAAVRITVIEPDSPAAKGGLKAGDIITRIGKIPVADIQGLADGLRATVRWYLENEAWCGEVTGDRYGGERLGLNT